VQTLTPLINAKNVAHNRMLSSNSAGARRAFRQSQRVVKKAVDKARENWILSVAMVAEETVNDGKTSWECIRQAHAGHKPCISRKVDGEWVLQCWHQHFSKL